MPASTAPHVTALLNRFAANLKRTRQDRGLSQAALAAAADVADSYVSMLERGQRIPPLDTVANLAHALHVPVRDLLS